MFSNSCIESLHPNAVAHLTEIDRTQLSPSSPEGSRNPIRPMPAEHLDNPFFLDRRGTARHSGGSASAADILYGSNVVVTYMAMEQCK